jgi:hypothetical protein
VVIDDLTVLADNLRKFLGQGFFYFLRPWKHRDADKRHTNLHDVIPAKSGIQNISGTGPRLPPG